MSWVKKHLGLDWFDLFVHVGLTVLFLGWAAMENAEEVFPLISIVSLVVLAVRRSIAMWRLKRTGQQNELTTGEVAAMRIAELEERIAELESAQFQIAELSERMDFAERLLAKPPAERVLPRGDAP